MKVQDLTITDEMNKIVQIGFVVPDLEKTKQAMLDVFGLEPDDGGVFRFQNCIHKDVEGRFEGPVLTAFYNFFNIQLEFLQPIEDQQTIWSDWIGEGKSGLHHIRFDVADNDRVSAMLAEKGIGIWMEGDSIVTPGAKFTYYDSIEKLGFILEAVTRSK